jgi:hypothetical protein
MSSSFLLPSPPFARGYGRKFEGFSLAGNYINE